MRVVFVCDGNYCRSPIAEALLRKLVAERELKDVEVRSGALLSFHIGESPNDWTRRAARSVGAEVSQHRASLLRPEDVTSAGLIVVMNDRQRRTIVDTFAPSAPVRLLTSYAADAPDEIVDPGEATPHVFAGYERCAREIAAAVRELVAVLE